MVLTKTREEKKEKNYDVRDQLSDAVGWKICFDAIPGVCTFTSGGAI